jgi:lipid-binding SYLF domain-containing protein
MLAGSGNGYGLAVDRKTNKLTYMSLRKLQVGFGAGIQEFRMLVIFKDRAKFDDFAGGSWSFGGGADVALQQRDQEEGIDGGLQATAMLDPIVYQITEAGINLSATADGVRYAPDDELN